ncbi:MAG TPA: hypothetical protein VGX69_01590 [Solirubrobacteraceae bacterium]|jgi:putative ABC transport system permease protein|nr:hypothetical protein [Solirubrobacteraceae bacterium]
MLEAFVDWAERVGRHGPADSDAEPLEQLAARARPAVDEIAEMQPAFVMALEAILQSRRSPALQEQLTGLRAPTPTRSSRRPARWPARSTYGVGCIAGAAFGLYGEQLADRALAQTIGFPVAHSITVPDALTSIALVLGAALAILALPGYLAADVPAALALQADAATFAS